MRYVELLISRMLHNKASNDEIYTFIKKNKLNFADLSYTIPKLLVKL